MTVRFSTIKKRKKYVSLSISSYFHNIISCVNKSQTSLNNPLTLPARMYDLKCAQPCVETFVKFYIWPTVRQKI